MEDEIKLYLKDLKLSDLPVGTVVADKTGDQFELEQPGIWSMLNIHCPECGEVVYDNPSTPVREQLKNRFYQEYELADYPDMHEFTIISLPVDVINFILTQFAFQTGSTAVFVEALKAVKDAQAQKEA